MPRVKCRPKKIQSQVEPWVVGLCGNIQGVKTLIANQPWLGLQEGVLRSLPGRDLALEGSRASACPGRHCGLQAKKWFS